MPGKPLQFHFIASSSIKSACIIVAHAQLKVLKMIIVYDRAAHTRVHGRVEDGAFCKRLNALYFISISGEPSNWLRKIVQMSGMVSFILLA